MEKTITNWNEISINVHTDANGDEYCDVNCALPKVGQEIYVTDGSKIWPDVFTGEGHLHCGLKSGFLFGADVIAWAPLEENEEIDT